MKNNIVFSIHPSTGNNLIIQIEEVTIDEDKIKWCGKGRKLFRDTLLKLSAGKDRKALNTLIEEQRVHINQTGRRESVDTMDFSRITIDYKRAIPVLKELAETGKLYFQHKKLFANFYGGVELNYKIEKENRNEVVVKGILKTPSKEYDLAECVLVARGEPNWLIKGDSLQIFRGELAWKWIRLIREEGFCRFSGEDGIEFLEELDQEKGLGAPQLDSDEELDCVADPLPVIALTDKTGAFANLLMDYGSENRIPIESPMEKWRNKEAEVSWKKDFLEGGFQEKKVAGSQYYCPLDKARETLQFFIELGWEVRDSANNKVLAQTAMDLELKSGKEAVLVSGKVKFGELEAKISDVVGAINRNDLFTPLSSGHVGLIPKDEIAKVCAGLLDGEVCAGGIKIPKHDIATLKDLFNAEANIGTEKNLEDLREKLQKVSVSEKMVPGKDFQGTLRGYQEEGIAWLSFLYGSGLHGILADDMGLGKTVQVLAFLSTIEITNPVLIVMPTSLLFHWKLEFEKFMPSLTVCTHHGSERHNEHQELQKFDIILTSYSILRRDQELLKKISFQGVILDEAQAIKNHGTQAATAVRQLSSQFRLSMTGTPIENHIGELLSQFKFLIPGLFDDNSEFDGVSKVEGHNPDFLKRIKRKVKPFILRRKKTDVDEQLPEKIEQTVWLEMHPEQRRIYAEFLGKMKEGLLKKVNEEGLGKHRMEVFEAILRLRQICCHPLLLSSVIDVETTMYSTKCDTLFEDLDILVEEGQKALVYSQFTSMLKVISHKCTERGWKYSYLDGNTKDREQAVRQFQEDSETQLMLVSLKAGGVGLNLTAADYVILYDPWWNEAVENQAIDRAHRIGRHDPVIAKRYVFKDTIEERMVALKESKRKLANDLFENNQSFDMEDLEFLLLDG